MQAWRGSLNGKRSQAASRPVLSGSEFVLVALVPRAGDRWKQVHIDRDLRARFFRVAPGQSIKVRLHRIDLQGAVVSSVERPLVFSEHNRKYKLEVSFGDVAAYPDAGAPILVVLETNLREFRYIDLLPGSPGYDRCWS